MDKNLLNKFTTNQCSSTEIDEFFHWLKKYPTERPGEKIIFRKYWDDIETKDPSDTEHAKKRLDRIHHTINLNWSKQKENGKKEFFSRGKVRCMQLITQAAVILLIPVLTLCIYTRFFQTESHLLSDVSQSVEIVAPPASRIQFELSDGTKVWLNQNSTLKYSQPFTGENRTVHLVGEGYFDIAPDKTKPFIVETQTIAVKAVGTSFNVKAYADENYFETTLESGKLLIYNNIGETRKEIYGINPSERFVLNKTTNNYSIQTVNPEKYVSWKDGKLIFQDDRLDEVAERMSRWFNAKIIMKDQELRSLTYTATFIDESLDQAMEMMEVVIPVSFIVSNKHKRPDGTFSEKEILIYKKGGKHH